MKNILKFLGLGLGFIAFAFAVVLNPSSVFAAPVITSIAPNFGATTGGTGVIITGTGFTDSTATVTVDGVSAATIAVDSSTQITISTPAGAAGLANVVVTNPTTNPGTSTLTNGFTYLVASSPTAVDLGTAGDFVILSKSGITATTGTVINGDLGISPAAATDMTGFDLALDASNTFSTSSLVTGRIFASDYSGGGGVTPSMLTTAVSDMEAAYTAALDPATTVLNAGAGNLGGMTLPAGVYKFDTSVTIPTDLTLDGSANDVWIFQISGGLSIASATDVILSGAVPENVFWAVAGTTTLGADSVFKGTILGGPETTTIALEEGATLNGKALGQKEVTLISNTITDSVVSDTKILAAGVTGLVAPRRGETPTLVGALTANAATYTVTGLSWSPTDSPFDHGTTYTATIELTSATGYKFPTTGILPTTDVGGRVSAGTTIGEVSGNTLTFTELFSKTGSPSSGGSRPSVSPITPVTNSAGGCSVGNLFNTSTGALCINNAVPQGCSGGNLFNTSTGATCTNNVVLQIPGCGNSTTGFSTATGGSCAGNHLTTLTTTYNLGTVILKNGSKGEAVKELQRFLNAKLALGLVIDGMLGPKTIAVIKTWQKDNGLVSDGLVGAKTKAEMNK